MLRWITTGAIPVLFLAVFCTQVDLSTPVDDSSGPDEVPPSIALRGSDTVAVFQYAEYNDPGAEAFDMVDRNLTAQITVSGSVNTETVGTYTLDYEVSDEAGNTSSVQRIVIVLSIDKRKPPVISLMGADTIRLEVGDSIPEPGVHASDSVEGDITEKVVVEPGGATSRPDSFAILYWVENSSGQADSAHRYIEVSDSAGEPVENLLPTASVSADIDSGYAPLDISFNAGESTDSDGAISEYAWEFGDGTTGTGKTVLHTYAAPGTYTVELVVTDNRGGTGAASLAITVSQKSDTTVPENVPPSAHLVHTLDSSFAPVTIHLDAGGSSDSDGEIVTYKWRVGDFDTSTTAAALQLHFENADTVTALVIVMDDRGGLDSATTEIEIASRPVSPVNTSPIADLKYTQDSSIVASTVSFDASGSTDSDGLIVSYDWGLGSFDTTTTSPSLEHVFTNPGSYKVVLEVTDDQEATDRDSVTVSVTAPIIENQNPVPSFTITKSSPYAPSTVQADASGSSDSDGSITEYGWTVEGVAAGTGANLFHEFTSAGSFDITLTVTDNDGGQASLSQTVQVESPPNTQPQASFTMSPTSGEAPLTVAFDATGSSDSDGSVVDWDWTFGDGSSGAGETVQHEFTAAGSFTVVLRVTDNDGAVDSTSLMVSVSAPADNQSPAAQFVVERQGVSLSYTFDAGASADPDGTIAEYSWDFGDGTNDTGAVVSHQFPGYGTYTAALTVTDNQGATASRTSFVNVRDVTLLDDFEDGDKRSLWNSFWYDFSDSSSGGASAVSIETTTGYDNGTAMGITTVLDQGGYAYDPFAGIGVYLGEDKAARDISSSTGVSFYYKGGGAGWNEVVLRIETVSVSQQDKTPYHRVYLPASSTWTSVAFTWDQFTQPDWSGVVPEGLDLTQVVKVSMQIKGDRNASGPESAEIWLDDLSFPGLNVDLTGN